MAQALLMFPWLFFLILFLLVFPSALLSSSSLPPLPVSLFPSYYIFLYASPFTSLFSPASVFFFLSPCPLHTPFLPHVFGFSHVHCVSLAPSPHYSPFIPTLQFTLHYNVIQYKIHKWIDEELNIQWEAVVVWRKCGRCVCGMWAVHCLSLAAPLQSVARCGGERTERSGAPGPWICILYLSIYLYKYIYIHTRTERPAPTDRQAGAEQHGAVRADRDLLPTITSGDLFIWRICELCPNMETPGCWLLLAAHLILLYQPGRTCCHPAPPHRTQNPTHSLLWSVLLNTARFSTCCANFPVIWQQPQVRWEETRSSQTNRKNKSACSLCVCIFIKLINRQLSFITRTVSVVRNALCVTSKGSNPKRTYILFFFF